MILTRPMFYVKCDACRATCPAPGDEVAAWTDPESAIEVAAASEWTIKEGKHYCDDHFVCEAQGCHVLLGPYAGEFDYRCGLHR